ncbi:hypothetical protein M8J76_016853 [Diaphorina citri]|nr:hypothetical protein M8J76_016853 [Diaphorina citri]KAI5725406.1 hypothetical protein M8J77_014926 [Diaphorina citri]
MLKLATGKAPGPDFIPPKVIRKAVLEIPEVFLVIFNRHLRDGTFPKNWKEARIVLLEKPIKNQGDPQTYRPICLLNTHGKLFEIVINERIKKEMEEKRTLNEHQFGFRRGKSTVDAINIVKELATAELVKGGKKSRRMCILTILDIKNAFNFANWEKIILALEAKGISSYLIKIIESYLHEREIVWERIL